MCTKFQLSSSSRFGDTAVQSFHWNALDLRTARWRKPVGIDIKRTYVIFTLSIRRSILEHQDPSSGSTLAGGGAQALQIVARSQNLAVISTHCG